MGGILTAGPNRFDKLLRSSMLLVLSVGALDMVNFGGIETVPPEFLDRRLHVHNAQVTLMRTSESENREIGKWIARKLNQSTSPFILLIPAAGVSMLDALGQPFHDPAADAALFEQLESQIKQTDERKIIRLPYHINDREFSQACVDQFLTLVQSNP